MKMECLYAPYKFRENETWFNECADQGLHIEEWGATHVDFSENADLDYQYRIDPDNGGIRPNGWREKEMEALGYE